MEEKKEPIFEITDKKEFVLSLISLAFKIVGTVIIYRELGAWATVGILLLTWLSSKSS
jgi:UPF0716 family protein affecting phage T7 exclusion